MILPIGHEESEVRRLPWVTIAIMAICVLTLLATNPMGELAEPAEPPAFSPVEEAAAYWRDRPYLDAPPEVLTEVAYDVAPNQRSQYIAMLKTSIDVLPEAEEVALEQAELDAILRGEGTHAEAAEGAEPAVVSPYRTWGLVGTEPTARGFFTHMFMHAGWLHLFGNLFILFMAGPALEDRWGRPLFAAFYVLAGLVSGGFFIAIEQAPVPLVGASGAIAAVLGAFLVRYAKTSIRFVYFFFVGRILSGTFEAPAWAVLPLWFGNELLSAAWGADDGVAYWAHVGGFLFGVATGLAIRQLGLEERFDAQIEAKVSVRGNSAVEAALDLRAAGDVEGAFAKLEAELARKAGDADAAIAYLDTAAALGRAPSALPAFTRAIKALLPAQADEAARCWLELCEHAPDALLDPLALLAISKSLAAQGLEAEAKRALRHAADPRNAALSPALALRVLDAARGQDAQAAAWAARFVVESPQVADEKKAKLRTELAALEAQVPPPEEPAVQAAERRTAPIDIGLDDAPVERAPAHDAHEANEPFSQEIGRMLDAGDLGEEPADTEEDHPRIAEPEAEPELADEELGALLASPRFADTKVTEAVPTGLDAKGVVVALAGGGKGRISFEKIQGVSVAAVAGLGPKPIVLVDLLLNWNALEENALRVVRLRSDRFDPRGLTPGAANPLEGLRGFLRELLAQTRAAALPDPEGARAAPIRHFTDLTTYQREVLDVA